MKKNTLGRQTGNASRQGFALITALVILTLIMLVGVASLRQSATQSKIAANTSAAGIAFQAADSAVEQVIIEIFTEFDGGIRNADGVMNALTRAPVFSRCVSGIDLPENGICSPFTGPAKVRSVSETSKATEIPDRTVTGNSTNTTAWRFYRIKGTGSVGENQFAIVTNIQEFAMPELTAGGDILDTTGRAQIGVR